MIDERKIDANTKCVLWDEDLPMVASDESNETVKEIQNAVFSLANGAKGVSVVVRPSIKGRNNKTGRLISDFILPDVWVISAFYDNGMWRFLIEEIANRTEEPKRRLYCYATSDVLSEMWRIVKEKLYQILSDDVGYFEIIDTVYHKELVDSVIYAHSSHTSVTRYAPIKSALKGKSHIWEWDDVLMSWKLVPIPPHLSANGTLVIGDDRLAKISFFDANIDITPSISKSNKKAYIQATGEILINSLAENVSYKNALVVALASFDYYDIVPLFLFGGFPFVSQIKGVKVDNYKFHNYGGMLYVKLGMRTSIDMQKKTPMWLR